MVKDLNELSPEELGELFPIEIVPFNPKWNELYQQEWHEIKKLLAFTAKRIEHFGSTAIPNMAAKPTIDILVEIPDDEVIKPLLIDQMINSGYHYIPRNDCPPPYMMFVKGYTPEGYKGQCYHLHMAPKDHVGLWDRLYFRDYLIANPVVAKEYETLKLELALKLRNDRDGYTQGKSEFIQKVMETIKSKFNAK